MNSDDKGWYVVCWQKGQRPLVLTVLGSELQQLGWKGAFLLKHATWAYELKEAAVFPDRESARRCATMVSVEPALARQDPNHEGHKGRLAVPERVEDVERHLIEEQIRG